MSDIKIELNRMKRSIPDFTKEDVTIHCNAGMMALVAAMMRTFIVELIERSTSGKEFEAAPELVNEIVRINHEMIGFVNKFDFKKTKEMNTDITIHCVPKAMAAYGILLDSNIENVWLIFEANKIPVLENGRQEIMKLIRQMRDCLGISYDWRKNN